MFGYIIVFIILLIPGVKMVWKLSTINGQINRKVGSV